MITSTTVIVASFIAAVLSGIVSLCKLADWKRHRGRPSGPVMRSSSGHALQYSTRIASLFGSAKREPVAHLDNVIDDIQTGDVLHFSGVEFHSWFNRIARWTRMSHSAMALRKDGKVFVAEMVGAFKIVRRGWRLGIDLGGFGLVPIEDYVSKHPGQLYVGHLAPEYLSRFSRKAAADAIGASARWKYGWLGILFQVAMAIPGVNAIAYMLTWRKINTPWGDKRPFCSWAVSLWAMAASQDPVPCLSPQLTTPAEIERSKLWGEPIALVP